jgi:predicted nucleic acid-binding protein
MVDVSRGASVYLDTNALIYMTEGSAAFRKSLEFFFKKAIAAEAQFVTSELALTEVLVHPIRDKNESLLVAYNDLFERFVKALPINRAILVRAAELRAQTLKFRTPDAIHVATAEQAGVQFFVTGDDGIDIPRPIIRYLLSETDSAAPK